MFCYCLLFDTRFCGLFFLWCHILTGRGIVRFVLEGFLFENFFNLGRGLKGFHFVISPRNVFKQVTKPVYKNNTVLRCNPLNLAIKNEGETT